MWLDVSCQLTLTGALAAGPPSPYEHAILSCDAPIHIGYCMRCREPMTPQEVQAPAIYELLAYHADASPPVQGQSHAWVERRHISCPGFAAFLITLQARRK